MSNITPSSTGRAAALALAVVVCAVCPRMLPADGNDGWMASVSLHKSSVRLWPRDGATVVQTPPDFHWPAPDARSRFEVTLRYPDGSERHRHTPVNWLNWDEPLPPGDYRWTVDLHRGQSVRKGGQHRFTVAGDAREFVVPDTDTLYERALGTERPRALPDKPDLDELLAERDDGVRLLLRRVRRSIEAESPFASADDLQGATNAEILNEVRRAREALFAYAASGREPFRGDAVRRTMTLAGWSPEGPTSFHQADQVARGVAATLVLGYDWLHGQLDPQQRKTLLAVLQRRMTDIHDALFTPGRRLSRHPYDSHGNHTLTLFAAMTAIMAGDIEDAAGWFADAVPMALHWTSPWGDEDGGFANGTAYAHWVNGDLLPAWNVWRRVIGVDVSQKAWVRNHARFLAYTLPPGTPAGLFGDGAERPLDEQWARYGVTYAQFAPGALADWYRAEARGGDYSRLQMLLAPTASATSGELPEGTPDAAWFPSIGWAAMHSDLADRDRTSVYFKSSPYGSFNHSHADQNSFVIRSGGRRLAIDSGYYDDYDTLHWRQWYKQTRAHNAITFDNGKGQDVFELSGEPGFGRIVSFETRPDVDIVTGEAGAAYGGALERAQRTLVYRRPGTVLVYDRLRSRDPHQWEWNIHALEEISVGDDQRSLVVRNGGESLCVTVLVAPELSFVQDRRFTASPQGDYPDQWHGAFVTRNKSRNLEMLTALEVGCPATRQRIRRDGGVLEIATADVLVRFGDAVTAQRAPP